MIYQALVQLLDVRLQHVVHRCSPERVYDEVRRPFRILILCSEEGTVRVFHQNPYSEADPQ